MNDKTEEKVPDPSPGRGTFSFDDFVSKKAKTPVIRHTTYLDNEAGHRRADIEDQILSLEKEINTLRSRTEKSKFMSLVEKGELTERITALESRLGPMREAFNLATAEVMDSAMTFYFQWPNMDKPKEVLDKAHKKWCEREGVDHTALDGAGSNLLLTQQQKLAEYGSCALVAAATIRVEYPDGSVQEGPLQVHQIEKLALSVMLPSEKEKLFQAISNSLGAADDWFSGIDAGFPG